MTERVFGAYVRFYIYLYQKLAGNGAENVFIESFLGTPEIRNTLWIDEKRHMKNHEFFLNDTGGDTTMHASFMEDVFLEP